MGREDKFFLLSLLSLAVSLFLFPMAIYLLPQVWLGWIYHTPDFVLSFSDYIQTVFGVTQENAQWALVYVLLGLGSIFAGIAYYSARQVRVDHKKSLPHEHVNEARLRLNRAKKNRREMIFLALKLTVIVGLVVIISQVVQWAMTVST